MNNSLYILDDSPRFEWIELASTDSTSNFVRNYHPAVPKEMTLVSTDFQTAGRGQVGNHWESEQGKNLLFSLRLQPTDIDARQQFILSQAMSLSICETLKEYTEGITIKWPNDIYWHDRKICGFLVENFLTGRRIDTCIIGVGVNVNQDAFRSDAPNPVSLKQITGKETERVFILARIIERFTGYYRQIRSGQHEDIILTYRQSLYRNTGFHPYTDSNGTFEAEIRDIEPDGHLILADKEGNLRRYAFKEVKCLIPTDHQSTIEL